LDVVTWHTMIQEIATIWVGNFCGECPIRETGRQVTVHFAMHITMHMIWICSAQVNIYKYIPGL